MDLKPQFWKYLDGAKRLVEFSEPVEGHLKRIGNVPLPPYIHETLADPERYQTIYATAARFGCRTYSRTAFFTRELLDKDQRYGGRNLLMWTLHVGLDTFAPVTEEMADEHRIHSEWCELPQATADLINKPEANGGG